VQSTADIKLASLANTRGGTKSNTGLFVAVLLSCALVAAAFASWLPLQVSIVTVFIFAGPHNWFELRYFLMRLPVRFGRSRNFFIAAFAGLGFLTTSYLSLPFIYQSGLLSTEAWTIALASWNTLLLAWIGSLIWLRSRQKSRANWSWAIPVLLALAAFNWWTPDLFSLAIVYLHPIVALWFLDRHLARTRKSWLRPYRVCLMLLPLILSLMIWHLSKTTPLADSNGLFWRITQHSGAELFPQVSSHMLVSVHLFLELLHYCVWIFALTLIGPLNQKVRANRRVWDVMSIPFARHPRGFPKFVSLLLVAGLFAVVALWAGFSLDYSTTRDLYFTIAIAHVLAEAPFLLRTM
jgi:hypothetical protein